MINWYLERFIQSDGRSAHQPLTSFPQVLGRDPSLTCVISAQSVSRHHAKIDDRDGSLWIEDLSSSNGTYVNRTRIDAPTQIRHGDVVHLGNVELRLIDINYGSDAIDDEPAGDQTMITGTDQLSEQFPTGVHELEELIRDELVAMAFQPIWRADGRTTTGYEVLGRGASDKVPASPLEIFRIAESFGLEVKLSEMLRKVGVEDAEKYGLKGELLLNTHPSELDNLPGLITSLEFLRNQFPHRAMILEIHEECATDDPEVLRELKTALDRLSFKLSFDDFGVGQSRFMDMVSTKPDLIKFDRALIDSIDTADQSRLNLLQRLKELATELNIATLAECVSTEGEYRVCDSMGFEYYQGWYFGRPGPAEKWANEDGGPGKG